MAGFRRIDAELLAKYRTQPARVMALLELDSDHFRNRVRPTQEYGRLWGVSRKVARAIVAEYLRSVAEWRTLERASRGPAKGQTRARPTLEIARDFARRGPVMGRQRAEVGPTTIETETKQGAPPKRGDPLFGRLIADPDEGWVPPGRLDWRAKQVNEFNALERPHRKADEFNDPPHRDLIRIRHASAEPERMEASK